MKELKKYKKIQKIESSSGVFRALSNLCDGAVSWEKVMAKRG